MRTKDIWFRLREAQFVYSHGPGSSMAAHMSGLHDTDDYFKPVFKHFKQRRPNIDLSMVIDFDNITNEQVQNNGLDPSSTEPPWGLGPPEKWKAYVHNEFPGFTFIRNPFMEGTHWYWIKRCLEDFPRKPNITNLDAHMDIGPDFSVWEHSKTERQELPIEKTLLWRLRWTTLGYHHDWNTKNYSADSFTPIPQDLQALSKYLAEQLRWPKYQSEAVIVNYYHGDSTLAGHTDHSELDNQSPLISVSFGQTALFMLGGPTKATKPITMFVRSGDVIVMEGPARLSYHAVPKVFTGTCDFNSRLWELSADGNPSEVFGDSSEAGEVDESDLFKPPHTNVMRTFVKNIDLNFHHEYLDKSRINMNIRQVLPQDRSNVIF